MWISATSVWGTCLAYVKRSIIVVVESHVNTDSQPITVLHELSLPLPAGGAVVVCIADEKRSNSSAMETRHLRLHVSYLQVKSMVASLLLRRYYGNKLSCCARSLLLYI